MQTNIRDLLKKTALLLLVTAAAAFAQDSTRALAEILAQKGIITAEQLARVEQAGPGEGVGLLAAMLRDKGILTPAESARFVAPDPPAAVATDRMPKPRSETAPAAAPAPAPVTLYGAIVWNSFYNTAPANNEDVPLLAAKNGTDPLQNFGMTARASRVGLRFQGPQVAGARFSGVLELDMYGGKAALSNGIDMDLLRLRLAYGRLDWKDFSLEAGQDWSIFAPLNPVSLASFGIPSFSASGNLWIRTPQLRAEVHRGPVLWQVAASDSDVGDYSTASFATLRTPGIGEHGRMPSIDTRLALATHIDSREASIGFSSHYGRGENTGTLVSQPVQRSVNSWGAALDYTLPLLPHLVLTGEAYQGRALGLFSSSSGQSVLPVGTPGEHGVQSRGGWVQAQINWTARWQTNVTYGLDAMNAANLRTGDRSKNQSYMANLMFKPSARVTFAWEWRRFLTNYQNQSTANNTGDQASMAVAYTF